MKRRKPWKKNGGRMAAAAVCGALCLAAGGFPVYATVAAQASPVTEYDEETLAKFQDNTLEYWEIPGLVERYNPAYQQQLDQFYYNPGSSTGLTKEQLKDVAETLRQEADILDETAREDKDSISKEEYEEYRNNVRILRARARDLEDAAAGRSAAGSAALRALRITKNQTVMAAAEQMRNLKLLEQKEKAAEKSLEIAELSFETEKRRMELGVCSQEEVLAAEEALNSARAAETAAENAGKDQKQALIRMLGWSYGADPVVGEIPKPDLSKIAGYDPAADAAEAIQKNITLFETRMTDSKAQGGVNAKARAIKDQENEVRTSLDLLYKDVLQKQAAYGAAETKFTADTADKAAADRKYGLGMLSRQEYLQAESAYLAAEAELMEASLALTGAMETYEWALEGMLELSSAAGEQSQGAM